MMMTTFKIFAVFPIVCLTLAAGGNHRSLGRVNDANSFRCPSEGFHPDPNDCRIFYRCVDWNSNVFFRDYNEPSLTQFQFTCGEGTVFDPEYNICNHPDQTSRKECAGRGDTSENQYPFTYPPSNAENYPSYPTHEVITSYPNEFENQISPDGEMLEPSPGECSGEGFFPVPGDCSRFIRCADDGMGGYRKFDFKCGEGTVWDQQNMVCNHPGSVPGCGGGGNEQYPEDGNPLENPQDGYPGDNQQGNRPDEFGYPQENYPNQGGYPGQQGNQPGQTGYPDTQGNQGGYPATDIRPPPENQGYPGQQNQGYPQQQQENRPSNQGNRPDQSGYPQQGGYPNQGGYPTPGNRPPPQNQGNRPPTNQQNQGNQPGYPQQGGYPNQQNQGNRPDQSGYPNQGGYPTPGNQPPPQNQGNRPPTNQQNQGNQSGYPQQGGYPNQQNQGSRPPTNQQNQGNQPGQPGYPQQSGYPNQQNQGSRPPTNQQNQGNQPGQPGYPQQGGYPNQQNQGSRPPTNQQNQGNQPGYPQQGGYPGQQNQGGYPTPGNQPPPQYPQQGNNPPTNQQNQGNQPGYPPQQGPQNQGYPQQGNRPNQSGYPQQGGYPGQTGPQNRPGNQGYGPNQSGYPQQGGQPGQGSPFQGSNPNQTPTGSPNQCQSDGFFSVPGDCMKFYRCVDNGKGGYMRYDFTCGPGTVWDQEITTCNHPWAVQRNDCPNTMTGGSDTNGGSSPEMQPSNLNQSASSTPNNQNQMSTQPTPSQQSPSTQTTNQQTTQRPDGTDGPQDGSTTPSNQPDSPPGSRPCQPEKNQPVKCEKSGFYPVPGNCKKFYRCVDWDGDKGERFSVYFFECGEGTIWDPALQTCNHEESVYPPRDCSGGQNNQTTQMTTTGPTTPDNTDTTTEDESTKPAESTTQATESMTTAEMTTEEATDRTTEPDNSKTTEPGDTNPTEPGTNNPTEPGDTNTTEPGTSNPTEPGDTTPTEPTTDEDNETNPPDSNPDCPALEEGQAAFVCPTGFRRHPKDCNLFYQCTISKEGDVNIMTFTCKNESVYDERKIQCLPPEETAPCPSNQNGKRRYTRSIGPEMTSVVPIASSESLCPREGHFPYDCHMFFKCKKDDRGRMEGYLYQCQPKHTFSPSSGRCERSSTMEKCGRSNQYLTPTNLKWMTSKVPIEYFDVR